MGRIQYDMAVPGSGPVVAAPPRRGCAAEPCWERTPDCCRCNACSGADCDSDAVYQTMWEAAAQWLYERTCYRFPGGCPISLAPCSSSCECSCECSCGSSCGNVRTMDMRHHWCYPVAYDPTTKAPRISIIENGVAWKLGVDFWMEDGWTIATCRSWPARQNLCQPPGTAGTWEIVADLGDDPPALLLRAVADLACELTKACLGEDTCLPDGVKSISRRGLSMDGGNEKIEFDGSITGLPTVDLALSLWACHDEDATYAPFVVRPTWRYTPRPILPAGVTPPLPPVAPGNATDPIPRIAGTSFPSLAPAPTRVCGTGATSYALVPGSAVNCTIANTPNTDRSFTVTPTAAGPWSYRFEILCDGVGSAQMATVAGTAIPAGTFPPPTPKTAFGIPLSWDPATEFPGTTPATYQPYLDAAKAAEASVVCATAKLPFEAQVIVWRPSDGWFPPNAEPYARAWANYTFAGPGNEASIELARWGYPAGLQVAYDQTVHFVTSSRMTMAQALAAGDNGDAFWDVFRADADDQLGKRGSVTQMRYFAMSVGRPHDYSDRVSDKDDTTGAWLDDGAGDTLWYAMGGGHTMAFRMGSGRLMPPGGAAELSHDWDVTRSPLFRWWSESTAKLVGYDRATMLHEFAHSVGAAHQKMAVHDPRGGIMGGSGTSPQGWTPFVALQVYASRVWGGDSPCVPDSPTFSATIDSMVKVGPTLWQASGTYTGDAPLMGLGFRVDDATSSDSYAYRFHIGEFDPATHTWTVTISEDRATGRYGAIAFAYPGGTETVWPFGVDVRKVLP